jgi:SAM-dependent methyltransferase
LACVCERKFPIRDGVPSFLLSTKTLQRGSTKDADPDAIAASFSHEWQVFRYEDRTWIQSVEERKQLFLREVGCDEGSLASRLVVDAGCGNGSLSAAVSEFGCQVLAIDASKSVFRAAQEFSATYPRAHFVHADLVRNPLREQIADVIYSSGVLHHNPNTRTAFEALLPALKPGGRIYIWVYEPIPGVRHALKQALRRLVAPLPAPLKTAFVAAWLPQAMLRQYLRRLFGSGSREDQLGWRERMVLLMDHYTPRYRWEHTQEEVHSWYRENGLVDCRTSEAREWGFGVVGTRPATR